MRDPAQWPHRYRAALKREELADSRLQAAANELFHGELAPLLTHLVRSERLTAEDRANPRKLLDELDSKGSAKGK